jgi:hypothetical protein
LCNNRCLKRTWREVVEQLRPSYEDFVITSTNPDIVEIADSSGYKSYYKLELNLSKLEKQIKVQRFYFS